MGWSPLSCVKYLENVKCVSGNIQTQPDFYNLANPKSTNYGLETLRHLGPIVWNAIPAITADSPCLSILRERIKGWDSWNCPCRLCKTYMHQIGFLNVANM